MSSFKTLFLYEFKKRFSLKKEKNDILGSIFSGLITLSIILVFIFLFSQIINNYVAIKINKVSEPIMRARELLCLFYLGIVAFISIICLEQIRKTISIGKDRVVLLRLPVKHQTIFLSKLTVLLLWNYLISLLFIFPISLLFYLAIDISVTYWLWTFIVWLVMPLVSFLIACILIIPYILVVDFIKKRYFLVFVSFSSILILGFLLYSKLLNVVQVLLETGAIKFIFNEGFTRMLQKFLKYGYPANAFASLVMGINVRNSLLIILGFAIISVLGIFFVTKELFYVSLYRTDRRIVYKNKITFKENNALVTLMKKEFINVFRDSKYVFSYFSIAAAMPVMVYCCFKLLRSLIIHTIGLNLTYPLALLVLLVFGVLTNTFCATNVSRDKLAMISTKTYPVKASKLMLSKVLFCSIISLLSVFISVAVLVWLTSLSIRDGIFCLLLGIMFTMAQIFISTKMDLKHAKLSLDEDEIENASNKTISKVILIGLVLALTVGIIAVVISVLALNNIKNISISIAFAYLIPIVISIIYLILSIVYYMRKIEERFMKISL